MLAGMALQVGTCAQCGKAAAAHQSFDRDGSLRIHAEPTYYFIKYDWNTPRDQQIVPFCSAACASKYAEHDYRRSAVLRE